jgi:hypothetical protein
MCTLRIFYSQMPVHLGATGATTVDVVVDVCCTTVTDQQGTKGTLPAFLRLDWSTGVT